MRALLLPLGLLLGCSSPVKAPSDAGGEIRPVDAGAPAGDLRSRPSAPAAVDGGAPDLPPAPPGKVKIFVNTDPPRRAEVYWGSRNLGKTPLSFERPQNSGPVDLVLRAGDYFPVHVRVFTERSDKVTVVLTKTADRMKLLGAKQEIVKEEGKPAPAPTPPAR